MDEKAILSTEKLNGDNPTPKKTKILTLLLPPETQAAEGKEQKKDKCKPPTKVVIRRLPPKLNKESFIEEFSPLPGHDYLHFVRADLSLGSNGFSRAYINFAHQGDIIAFREKFDDHVIKDEKGKEYHAVVEFAPFQKVPRKSIQKKKILKAGTLEEDPKYVEFLQKLEEIKNNTSNTSEYFHETEVVTMKEKITTTPLLEFLKQKRQKKIDLRNELRQKKRDAEKERRRKEDEKRKIDRDRRIKDEKVDKKISKQGERIKDDDKRGVKGRDKVKRKHERRDSEADSQTAAAITMDPAVLKVVVGETEREGSPLKLNEKSAGKNTEGDLNVKSDKKYSETKGKSIDDKHKKAQQKRDVAEVKSHRIGNTGKKIQADDKGDSSHPVNNTEDKGKKRDSETRKTQDVAMGEAKSKFRYSEQRNRDREFRIQKTTESKAHESKPKQVINDEETGTTNRGGAVAEEKVIGSGSHVGRRKSLDLDRGVVECDRKRSKSFHDEANDGPEPVGNSRTGDSNQANQRVDDTDDSVNGDDVPRNYGYSKKDPRIDRRIRNKDRPSIEIYRPGMGKLSKHRIDQKKDEPNSPKPSKTGKSAKKSMQTESSSKVSSDVKTMTFTRTAGKDV